MQLANTWPGLWQKVQKAPTSCELLFLLPLPFLFFFFLSPLLLLLFLRGHSLRQCISPQSQALGG